MVSYSVLRRSEKSKFEEKSLKVRLNKRNLIAWIEDCALIFNNWIILEGISASKPFKTISSDRLTLHDRLICNNADSFAQYTRQ